MADHIIDSLFNVGRSETSQRVGNHDEAEIRHAPELGHLFRRVIERVGDDRNRGNTCFLEHYGVEQTARRTRPSIPNARDYEIYLAFQLCDLIVGQRRTLMLVKQHFQLHTVHALEL